MSNPPDISPRSIEEAALRAWPAAQQFLFDGWVARLSDGYTKRANSALLLYPQAESASDETLARIERPTSRKGCRSSSGCFPSPHQPISILDWKPRATCQPTRRSS